MGDRLGTPGAVGFWPSFWRNFFDATDDYVVENLIQCARMICAQVRAHAPTGAQRIRRNWHNYVEILVIISLFSKIPNPQPNVEIRKPNKELTFTLISVTIGSLIFFICNVSFDRHFGHSLSLRKLVDPRVTNVKKLEKMCVERRNEMCVKNVTKLQIKPDRNLQ